MRVFVLEDKPERIICFNNFLSDTDVQYIQTSNRWTEFSPPYDYVFLDHDLGGREGEPHEDCGLTFLKYAQRRLEDQRHERPSARIILHTFNSDAAGRMLEYLAAKAPGLKAEWMPFYGDEFRRVVSEIQGKIDD